MPKSSAERPTFYPRDRQEWRAWLETNHATSNAIWLVYYKKDSGQPTVTYDEAVEEALCYGWIDSTPNKLDDQRFMQLFSPRKAKSPWSGLNKRRIESLMQQDLMAEPGLAKIEAAQKDGSWTLYDDIETLTIPHDLQQALNENEAANTFFTAFNPSSKKGILWWIKSAKRPETRAQRIQETVRLAAVNKRAQFDRE
jgi:uncharacterized protein YdeI (YjbR/CyaY-like superfamily)